MYLCMAFRRGVAKMIGWLEDESVLIPSCTVLVLQQPG